MPRRPTFVVLGAEKAGTTWVYATLRRHPDVYLPDVKELSFFNRLDSNGRTSDNFVRCGLGWYEAFYSGRRGETAAGDISPMYLCDTDAPARMHGLMPDVTLLCFLRDPVDRAWSHYNMALSKRHTADSFEAIVARRDERFVGRGFYADQIARYEALFGPGRVHVFVFEEFFSDPMRHIDDLCRTIGVAAAPLRDGALTERENAAAAYRSPRLLDAGIGVASWMRRTPGLAQVGRLLKASGLYGKVRAWNEIPQRNPPLPDALHAQLRDIFRDDVTRLEERLGRRIDAWHRERVQEPGTVAVDAD